RLSAQTESLRGERRHRGERYISQVHVRAELPEQLHLLGFHRSFEDELVRRILGENRADPIPFYASVRVEDPDTSTGFAALDDDLTGFEGPRPGDLGVGLLERKLVLGVLFADLHVELETRPANLFREPVDLGLGELDDPARHLDDVEFELPGLLNHLRNPVVDHRILEKGSPGRDVDRYVVIEADPFAKLVPGKEQRESPTDLGDIEVGGEIAEFLCRQVTQAVEHVSDPSRARSLDLRGARRKERRLRTNLSRTRRHRPHSYADIVYIWTNPTPKSAGRASGVGR